MCGIAGSLGPGAEEGTGSVERMLALLDHRGPDDRGVWASPSSSGAIALGVTRLAIRDPSTRGQQPMVSAATGCVAAYNGELYNAAELRAALEDAGRRFESDCDTEVVLAAFEHWGEGCIARLRGMFAAALWDPRAETLVLARDPLGIKPLYLREGGGTLTFASELRALIHEGPSSPTLNLAGLDGFLATGAPPEPATMVEGVELLGAGTIAIVRDGGLSRKRYWDLAALFDSPPRTDGRRAAESVRAALEASVRRQLVADVPVGVFLSGGVDSSALVGLAAAAGRPPRTLSVVFDEPGYSEAPHIEAVRRRWQTVHHELELSSDEMLGRLPLAIAAMDQPTVDGINTHVVSALSRETGLKVALSGLGADELFGGYELFRAVPRLHTARRLVPGLPRTVARGVAGVRYGRGDRANKVGRWLGGETGHAYDLARELMRPAVREALTGRHNGVATAAGPACDANTISRLELSGYLRNTLLRDADTMGMASSLEIRVPMLDQEVVELLAGIPSDVKVARGRQKPLLVDAVGDLLPAQVANRPKQGFTLPFERWLRGALAAPVRDNLLDGSRGGQVAQALDAGAVAGVWQDFERGRTGWQRPWALHVLKLWGERHLPA